MAKCIITHSLRQIKARTKLSNSSSKTTGR